MRRSSSTSTIAVRNARARMRRGDAGAHQARAQHAGRVDGPRLRPRHRSRPGRATSRFFMKKIAIRLPSIGEPTISPTAFCSALRPSSSGRLQPSRIALRATSGAGYWPFVFDFGPVPRRPRRRTSTGPGRGRAARGACSRRSFHSPLCWRYSIRRSPSSTSRSAGTASKTRPSAAAFCGRDRLARGDHLDRRVQADQPRQPLRPAPARDHADLDLGQADLRVRRRRGQPVVHRQDQLGPAAQAVAVDQGDGRKRQPAEPAEDLMAGAERLAACSAVAYASAASSLRSAPAMNCPGLPLLQQQAAQVGPLRQLRRPGRPARGAPAGRSVFTFLSGRSKVTSAIPPSSSSTRNASGMATPFVRRSMAFQPDADRVGPDCTAAGPDRTESGWTSLTYCEYGIRISSASMPAIASKPTVGDLLAELGDRAEIRVGRPLAGELAPQVLAEDVGRVLDEAARTAGRPRGWWRGSRPGPGPAATARPSGTGGRPA